MSFNYTSVLSQLRLQFFSIAHWRYDPNSGRRDLRLDFLRGLFLVFMIVYHFRHAWMIRYTHEFFGTVSAAEGFVFISGMIVGLVYLPHLERLGMAATIRKAWQRALHIYLAAIGLLAGLIVLHLSIFKFKPLASNLPAVSLPEIVREIATFRYVPFGFDILMLYIMLLGLTPLALWLVHTHRARWLLVGSIVLYLMYHLSPATFLWNFINKEVWRFPFMVWQLVYVAGLLAATHQTRLKNYWAKLPSRFGALLILLLFFVFFAFRQMLDHGMLKVDQELYLFWFDKTMLGPGRLINFVVLGIVVYWVTDRFWEPLVRGPGKFLIPLGQASLYVFLMHLALAYLYRTFPVTVLPLATTGIYEGLAVLLIWYMVRRRFLFRLVPH